jgi:hypothetical protein
VVVISTFYVSITVILITAWGQKDYRILTLRCLDIQMCSKYYSYILHFYESFIVISDNTLRLYYSGPLYVIIQGDQNVSVYLMIAIQKVTSNVQSVPCQSPDIY